MRISVNFPRTFEAPYDPSELKSIGFDIKHSHFGVTLTFPEGWTVVDFYEFFDENGTKRGFITHDDGGYIIFFPRFDIRKIHLDTTNNVLGVYDAKHGEEPIFVTENNDDYFDSVRTARKWLIDYIETQGMSYDRTLEPSLVTQLDKEFYIFIYSQGDPLLKEEFMFWK